MVYIGDVMVDGSNLINVMIDDEDRQAADDVLNKRGIRRMTSADDKSGITPVAARLLEHVYHFLRWDGSSKRDPSVIAGMINRVDFAHEKPEIIPEMLVQIISNSLKYSSIGCSVVGVMATVSAVLSIFGSLKWAQDFLSTLNWTVIDTSDNINTIVVQRLPMNDPELPSDKRYLSHHMFYLLEGMMVANTLYPEIGYRPGLDEVILIPKYDTWLELFVDDYRMRYQKYRILVPGVNFSDNYLNDIKEHNRFFDGTGYIAFESAKFLQGLLALTQTIGIDQPWIRSEIREKHLWKLAPVHQ